MKPPIRIAVLHFSHETVTFLANDTTLADFTYPGSPAAGEALLTCDPRGYMGGFVKMARELEAVEVVGIESPLWPRTGTGSGWITTEAFETFVGKMVEELHMQGRSTAPISASMVLLACEMCRGRRRSWQSGCARLSVPRGASPPPSIRTATRTRSSSATPTWPSP
jgi:Metallopeptidase family M81